MSMSVPCTWLYSSIYIQLAGGICFIYLQFKMWLCACCCTECIAVVNAVHRLRCAMLLCQCRLCRCCTCRSRYEVGQCPCRNTTCQCVSACWVHNSHYSHTVLRARTTRQLSASLVTTHNCKPARLQNSCSAQTWALLWLSTWHWMTAF